MEKDKRKEQPVHTRRYWAFFSLLTLLLIFPLRFHGWYEGGELVEVYELNFKIYVVISVVIVGVLLCFIFRCRSYLRRQMALLAIMVFCLLLSIVNVNFVHKTNFCSEVDRNSDYLGNYVIYTADWLIIEPVWCTPNAISGYFHPHEVVRVKNTNITIDIWWFREMMFPDGRPHFTG